MQVQPPLQGYFSGGPYQNIRYIFWNPHLMILNVTLVPERSQGGILVDRVFKIPSNMQAYIFRARLKNALKDVACILGTSPHFKRR